MTASDFAELRRRIKEAGLMERSWQRYLGAFWLTTAFLLISISIFFLTDNVWITLLNAVCLAFIYGRFGLLAHDFGHMQVFASTKANNFWGNVCGTVVGLSYPWWKDKHNQHHAHTNHDHHDPDIELPILAYSEGQALRKKGLARWIVRHQAWFFFPIQLLAAVSLRTSSWKYVLSRKDKKTFALDLGLGSLHATVYLALIFLTTPWWLGLIFIVVHQKAWSFYITSIFAPNHKGMPVLEEDEGGIDFMREQIMTARNIHPGLLTDFYYGHLNYQIEHHLFPNMPRHNSRKARKIVKEFCKEKNIEYYETGIVRSYVEIMKHMHEVGLCLRKG